MFQNQLIISGQQICEQWKRLIEMNLSTNQESPMWQQQNKDYFWCSFQARQHSSIVIQLIALTGQIVFASVLIYAYMLAKKRSQLQRTKTIYSIIFIWLICFFLKTSVNTIAYFVYIQHSPLNIQNHPTNGVGDDINFMGLRIMSAFFLLLDSTTTFFIQMAMIYIPFLWMKNGINGIEFLQEESLSVEDRIKIGRISWFLVIVKKYLLIRNIYALYFIAVTIVVISCECFQDNGKYIVIVSMLESLVILVVYPFGLWTLNTIKKNIALTDKQSKAMFIEYTILLLSNGVRIILNSVFYFSNVVHYKPDQYCYDNHVENETMINCLYLSFGLSLMHFLPAAIILYVYWPSSRPTSQFQKSTIASQYRPL